MGSRTSLPSPFHCLQRRVIPDGRAWLSPAHIQKDGSLSIPLQSPPACHIANACALRSSISCRVALLPSPSPQLLLPARLIHPRLFFALHMPAVAPPSHLRHTDCGPSWHNNGSPLLPRPGEALSIADPSSSSPTHLGFSRLLCCAALPLSRSTCHGAAGLRVSAAGCRCDTTRY